MDIIIFGAGLRGASIFKEAKENGLNITYILDNKGENGQTVHGVEVLKPDDNRLNEHKTAPVFIAVANGAAVLEIQEQLTALGFSNLVMTDGVHKSYYPTTQVLENVAFEFLNGLVGKLPNAETLGNSLLSILQLQEDSKGDWDTVKKLVCGSNAQDVLDAIAGGSLRKISGACLSYIHAISKSDACHKALEVRLSVPTNIDYYIAHSLFTQIVRTCFIGRDAQVAFSSLMAADHKAVAPYAYAAAARAELDDGNISAAFSFAQKSQALCRPRLYISDLYYDIGIAAREASLNLNVPVMLDDLSDRFCIMPFDNLSLVRFDFNINNVGLVRVCQCGGYSELHVDYSSGWNSIAHQKMRASILDGSFRYCNRHSCLGIMQNHLIKKSEIKNERHKDIIENSKIMLPDIENLRLAYDRSCNLKCPSCRSNFFNYSKEQIDALIKFSEAELLPLLKTVSYFSISMTGEALASPHCLHILSKLSPHEYPNLKILFKTNGSHDLEAKWKLLGDAASLIKIIHVSIDGSNKQTFEKMRYPAKWEKLTASMDFLAGLMAGGSFERLQVHYVLQKDNYTQLLEMLNLVIKWNVTHFNLLKINNFDMTPAEFKEKNIFDTTHPLHGDFIKEIRKFEDEKKRLRLSGVELPKGLHDLTYLLYSAEEPIDLADYESVNLEI